MFCEGVFIVFYFLFKLREFEILRYLFGVFVVWKVGNWKIVIMNKLIFFVGLLVLL